MQMYTYKGLETAAVEANLMRMTWLMPVVEQVEQREGVVRAVEWHRDEDFCCGVGKQTPTVDWFQSKKS